MPYAFCEPLYGPDGAVACRRTLPCGSCPSRRRAARSRRGRATALRPRRPPRGWTRRTGACARPGGGTCAWGEWEGRRLRREARRCGAACAPVAHGEDAPEHTLVQQRVAHPLRDNHIDAAAAAWASSSSSSGGRPRSSRDGPRDVGRLRLAAQAVDAARHAVRSDDEACVLDDLWGGGEKGGGEDEGGAGAKGDERALRKPSVRRTMEASSATTARAPAVAAKRDRMPVPHPTSRATRPGPLPPPPNHDGLRSMASR